ncbi:MAG: small, acid-soluble spore protein, alpha/beta type [Mycobacterium leprae]
MADNNRNEALVASARPALDRLKYEVAQEIGWNPASLPDLQQKIDQAKFEVADSIGVPLQHGYNGDLTSREAGAIGGRLGGRLGGQMVKRMIANAEAALAANESTTAGELGNHWRPG